MTKLDLDESHRKAIWPYLLCVQAYLVRPISGGPVDQ